MAATRVVKITRTMQERIQRVSKEQLAEARRLSNPFERIGKSIFMNRAATKLAALDATFSLTSTPDNKPFYFADVCGGPGGFSGTYSCASRTAD